MNFIHRLSQLTHKAKLIERLPYFLLALFFAWWAGGLLAVSLLGFTPTWGFTNLFLVWQAGCEGVASFSFLFMSLMPLLFWMWLQGSLYRIMAEQIGIFIVAIAAAMSLSLAAYGSLYHISPMPLWPWDWYHLAVYNRPMISSPTSLWVFSGLAGFVMLVLYGWLYVNPHRNKLGDAHFASQFEVYKAKLFNQTGIVIAKAYHQILRVQGHEGMLVVAPMGSGKTAAVAIPNLLEWQGSVVVNDLKGELWTKTSGFRQQHLHNACYCWSPSEEKSAHRQNPFFYVSHNKNEWYRDLQLIAQSLIPTGSHETNFWIQSSRDLFLFLAMYLFETKGMATLAEIYDLAKQSNFVGWLTEVIETGENSYPDMLLRNALALINANNETRSNILQDFYSRITLFGDPIIQKNTATTDFDIRQIRKQKMSVYIHIPAREKERLSPLLTLFWAQLIDNLTIKEPDIMEEPYSVLAIMDEFGSLAKIDKLKNGASFVRSFHIVLMIIVQYIGQVESVYGKTDARSFLNMKIKMAFTLNDIQDAKYFSECIGQTTVRMRSRNISSRHSGSSVGTHYSEQLRPLMRPEEIMRLPSENAIILVEGHPPIKARKCFYFKELSYRHLFKQYNSRFLTD